MRRKNLWHLEYHRRQGINRVARAIEGVTAAFRDAFTPAIRDFHFGLQSIMVDLLLASPPWRYVRLRWSLRKSPRWTAIYPPVES